MPPVNYHLGLTFSRCMFHSHQAMTPRDAALFSLPPSPWSSPIPHLLQIAPLQNDTHKRAILRFRYERSGRVLPTLHLQVREQRGNVCSSLIVGNF